MMHDHGRPGQWVRGLIVLLVLLISGLLAALSTSPIMVRGVVTDMVSGAPVPGAEIAAGRVSGRSGADGSFVLASVARGHLVSISAPAYEPIRLRLPQKSPFDREVTLSVALSPTVLTGRVIDTETRTAIGGALVRAGPELQVQSDSEGRYTLLRVVRGATITVQADGYETTSSSYDGQGEMDLSLAPNTVRGIIRDAENGQPIAAAQVAVGDAIYTTDVEGRVVVRRLKRGAIIQASADGYQPATVTFASGDLVVDLAPNRVVGMVVDDYTDRPLKGAQVTTRASPESPPIHTDSTGVFALTRVKKGTIITARADGYDTASLSFDGRAALQIRLRPNTLTGVVRDAVTGAPIAGATVTAGAVSATTGADGRYFLAGVPPDVKLMVTAAGYDRQRLAIGRGTTLDMTLSPFAARGIYIPFYLLTVPQRVSALIDFADRQGLNTVVVDVKGDDGYLAYTSALTLAKEIKASYTRAIMPMDHVLALAKERGIYTVARIVVFKDNVLALARPDLAVQDRRTGKPWDDCGNGTTFWADPFRTEVQEYNIGIAEEAARLGFDEIQFDYIRFPPACLGDRLQYARYLTESTPASRVEAIGQFLARARARVKPLGTALAVDTFGWTTIMETELGIGQRLEDMAPFIDYLSPMVYPSTWEPGALGLDYVPAHPYDIVKQSVASARRRLAKFPQVKIRPWLQDYDDYQEKKLPYRAKELDAQIRASVEAGGVGWMLWNAGGVFTWEHELPVGRETR